MKASVEDLGQHEDEAGILRTRDYFHSLIRDEKTNKGIPSERIVIGGFSQGGSISIISGLSCPTKLGGIFALSSYLPLRDKAMDMIPSDNPNKDTNIFMGHGIDDPLVKFDWGVKTAEKLMEWGYTVDFHGYPYVPIPYFASFTLTCRCSGLDHSANIREMDDFEEYLAKVLPPVGDRQQSQP
jgi:predicted esterase